MTTAVISSASKHFNGSDYRLGHRIRYKMVTVKQAKSLANVIKVQLTGMIVKTISDEKYEFKNATGSITIEIDDKDLKGRQIINNTPVTIIGEVDVEHESKQRVKIDVDIVEF